MPNLIAAAANGDLPAIEQALEAGEDVDAQDSRCRTPAMVATYADQPEAVALLFRHHANPDIRDDMLNNPLLYAGAEGNLEILALANDAGADPVIVNRYGGTALIPACERAHLDVIRYLLEHTHLDIDHVNNLGWTALLEAIILSDGGPNHQETVKILITHDVDVNIADLDGVTPLALARRRGFTHIAELLDIADHLIALAER